MSEIPPKTGLKAVDPDVVREDLSMPAPKELRVVEAEETELSLKADQFVSGHSTPSFPPFSKVCDNPQGSI